MFIYSLFYKFILIIYFSSFLLKYIIKFLMVSLSFLDSLSKPDKEYSKVLLFFTSKYSQNIWSSPMLNKLQILIKTS